MTTLQEAIITLDNAGLTDVILPFILIFVVVFAIMQKTKVLTDVRKINALIALVLGLSVVIPHVLSPSPDDVVHIMKSALPSVSAFLVAILALFLLVGMWGVSPKWASPQSGWITILAVALVGFLFLKAAGVLQTMPSWLNWLDDSTTQTLLIFLVVFIAIIAYVTGEPGKGKTISQRIEPFGGLFEGQQKKGP